MIGLVCYVMSCLCFCLLIKVKTTWCEKVGRRTFICTHSLKTNVRKLLFVLFLSTNVNISVTVWVKIWIFRDLLQWQHALNLVWTPQVCVRQSSTKLLDFVPHKCLTWLRSGVSEDSAWRVDVLTVCSLPDDAPSLPLPSRIFTLSVYYQMCETISLISIMDPSLPHSLRRSPLAFLCPATRGHQSQTFNLSLSLWLSAVSRLNLTLCAASRLDLSRALDNTFSFVLFDRRHSHAFSFLL